MAERTGGEIVAEFQEVMRQLDRLCRNTTCDEDCPMCTECNNIAQCGDTIHPERIERIVMAWAAEHPEPVYPTWEEWLEEVGFVKKTIIKDFIHREYCWKEHISPDIAQKLGLQPKEGT